jgi:hypothetical protein
VYQTRFSYGNISVEFFGGFPEPEAYISGHQFSSPDLVEMGMMPGRVTEELDAPLLF